MAYFIGLVALLMVFDICQRIYHKHKEKVGRRPWSEY
jgi:hypothetical protein